MSEHRSPGEVGPIPPSDSSSGDFLRGSNPDPSVGGDERRQQVQENEADAEKLRLEKQEEAKLMLEEQQRRRESEALQAQAHARTAELMAGIAKETNGRQWRSSNGSCSRGFNS